MNERTILLADDDELLASSLNVRLKKTRNKVDHVLDKKEVKKCLFHTMPAIIASDTLTPYFYGIELFNYVRNELLSQSPIIINSSPGTEENILSAFELGANDFISKPVGPSELLVMIAREVNKTHF
jgi:DNA-binding response OmpR family regulator